MQPPPLHRPVNKLPCKRSTNRKAHTMNHTPHDIDPTNPLARAKRTLEMLDFIFPGYTIQAATTEALQDLMHLEDSTPEKLHLIGALEDARNQHEAIAEPEAGGAAPAGPGSGVAAAPGETAGTTISGGETAQATPHGSNVVSLEARRFEKGHSDEPQPA